MNVFSDIKNNINRYFGLEVPSDNEIVSCQQGQVRGQTFVLKNYMEENTDCWHEMAEKQGLDVKAFDYATWGFVGM